MDGQRRRDGCDSDGDGIGAVIRRSLFFGGLNYAALSSERPECVPHDVTKCSLREYRTVVSPDVAASAFMSRFPNPVSKANV